ncbi:MAG: septum formation initiator family protein [Treponema sp.]|jgi:cell division protein FtsB|nr:septum formation initiator family protein [Treponema sp.]
MRFRKYLLVPWTAIAIYALSSLFAGAAGIGSYRDLLEEKERIFENLEDLETLNQELEGTMDALLYDSETIRIRARELGYGEETERFVRIVGLPGARYRETTAGIVKTAAKPSYIPDRVLRIVSVLAGLTIFLVFFTRDLFSGSSATRPRPLFPD